MGFKAYGFARAVDVFNNLTGSWNPRIVHELCRTIIVGVSSILIPIVFQRGFADEFPSNFSILAFEEVVVVVLAQLDAVRIACLTADNDLDFLVFGAQIDRRATQTGNGLPLGVAAAPVPIPTRYFLSPPEMVSILYRGRLHVPLIKKS